VAVSLDGVIVFVTSDNNHYRTIAYKRRSRRLALGRPKYACFGDTVDGRWP